jgi:formylglycine-generating enzyme
MRTTIYHIFILLIFKATSFAQNRAMKPNEKKETKVTTSERRLALVIGIKDYKRKEAQLTNPVNDANDVAEALEELGFTVIKKNNLSRTEFLEVVDDFGAKLPNYQAGLFYYSGHGLQFAGVNYLVPTDANMSSEPQIEHHCVPLGRVLSAMEGAQTKTNLVFLDACRDNPFKKSWASRGSGITGFTNPNNPPGTSVVFATSAGSTASDNNPNEKNGLFTGELLKFIKSPNLPLSQILYKTKASVFEKSNQMQMPEEYNKLFGDFYFIKSTQKIEVLDNSSNNNIVDNKKTEVSNDNYTPTSTNINTSKSIYLQGNTFKMGLRGQSMDEKPVHDVKLDNFWVSKFEVTVAEWKEYCNATKKVMPRLPDWGWQDNEPIVGISWYDAIDYCNWLSSKSSLAPCYRKSGNEVEWIKTANGYRLPTEAEWEFAARGGKLTKNFTYSGSEDPKSTGWYNENSDNKPHKVGTKIPNEMGVFDMSGNVREWCWDWYDETYYRFSPKENPSGPESGRTKVSRGGSWLTNDISVTIRISNTPDVNPLDCGIRIVRNQ